MINFLILHNYSFIPVSLDHFSFSKSLTLLNFLAYQMKIIFIMTSFALFYVFKRKCNGIWGQKWTSYPFWDSNVREIFCLFLNEWFLFHHISRGWHCLVLFPFLHQVIFNSMRKLPHPYQYLWLISIFLQVFSTWQTCSWHLLHFHV